MVIHGKLLEQMHTTIKNYKHGEVRVAVDFQSIEPVFAQNRDNLLLQETLRSFLTINLTP